MNPRTFCQTRGVAVRGVILDDLTLVWAAQNPRGFARNSTNAPQDCGVRNSDPEHPPPFLKTERCAICNGTVVIDKGTSWVEIVIDRVALFRADENLVDTEDAGWRGIRPVGPGCAEQFPEYTFCWRPERSDG